MSNYTLEELQGMSRVQLRRAAIEVLKIDNKEASNSKSGDLIERIVELGGNGNGNGTKKTAEKAAKKTRRAASTKPKSKPAEETAPPTNGVGEMVDAVGRAVDETKEELSTKLDEILENHDAVMRQQYLIFGLLCDIFKAVEEPDLLSPRLEELDEEWANQGN